MIFKIIAFVAAAIPISDLAVSIFLLLIACVVIFAVGKLIWAWL
jgi:hypothetical protein